MPSPAGPAALREVRWTSQQSRRESGGAGRLGNRNGACGSERQLGAATWAGIAARAVLSGTLLAIVLVDFIAAAMVVRTIAFAINSDPTVKAGPMCVTMVLTTISASSRCSSAQSPSSSSEYRKHVWNGPASLDSRRRRLRRPQPSSETARPPEAMRADSAGESASAICTMLAVAELIRPFAFAYG